MIQREIKGLTGWTFTEKYYDTENFRDKTLYFLNFDKFEIKG